MSTQHNLKRFQGFRSPNYTQVPDQLFDELMPDLSGSELKVLLYIIRRTYGFKRNSDTIALSQMLNGITKKDGTIQDRGAGVSKPSLLQALRSLQDQNIIIAERQESEKGGHSPTLYRVNEYSEPPGKETYPPLVKKVNQGVDLGVGQETSPRARTRNLTIQDTYTQETVLQETDIHNSNIRVAQPQENESANGQHHGRASTGANGFETAGNVLASPSQGHVSRPRPETETEEWQAILQYMEDFRRDLGDRASLKNTATRAHNLFLAYGRPLGSFLDKMYQARSLTQESSATITGTVTDSRGMTRKAKMAYFFAVLEDQLGLVPEEKAQARRKKHSPAPAATKTDPDDLRGRRSDGYEDYILR